MMRIKIIRQIDLKTSGFCFIFLREMKSCAMQNSGQNSYSVHMNISRNFRRSARKTEYISKLHVCRK